MAVCKAQDEAKCITVYDFVSTCSAKGRFQSNLNIIILYFVHVLVFQHGREML